MFCVRCLSPNVRMEERDSERATALDKQIVQAMIAKMWTLENSIISIQA